MLVNAVFTFRFPNPPTQTEKNALYLYPDVFDFNSTQTTYTQHWEDLDLGQGGHLVVRKGHVTRVVTYWVLVRTFLIMDRHL